MSNLGPELEAILAKDDTEVMLGELRELFGADLDVDSRFTIAQVITAMESSFRHGVGHAEMIGRAFNEANRRVDVYGGNNALENCKQSQTESAESLGQTGEADLSGVREETSGTCLLQGSSESLLNELCDQASRLRTALIRVGKKYPEEAVIDSSYILATGIHNRARKIRARDRDRSGLSHTGVDRG